MTSSLRSRLFAILALATCLVWAFAAGWIWLSTRAEVERVLDSRLVEAARMVSSLIDSQEIGTTMAALDTMPAPEPHAHTAYERQISCQIWSLSGTLVGRSDGAPTARLSEAPSGFSDRMVEGETWRVYTVRNENLGVEVLVGDNMSIRRRLVADMMTGLAIPMGLGLPILGGFLWLGAGRGLRPLGRLAGGLEARRAEDLEPIPADGAPSEIRTVVTALNGLFARVTEARDHERQFLAFAAHELRTPLAGLKTQAEIAERAPDPAMRAAALARMKTAVDRSSRLVTQLLAMAEAEASEPRLAPIEEPERFLRELLADQRDAIERRGGRLLVAVEDGARPRADAALLALALRNLVENAVAHSPQGGTVRVLASNEGFDVEDEGAGLSEEEIGRATDRFFRGRNKVGIGSGLGLAIADLAASRMGATLALSRRDPNGLRAEIRLAPSPEPQGTIIQRMA
ncbi:HAMP domain-containing protein [Fulvimarina endophytica]|uniref:histidine kinase n=1 Tax=Fulvimarina endophytica TaxID=2293836 RepID=A0A371X4M9_9HYPH|nr:ATP-binding protein [Fulvimarina endophytica]RFC64196.1 HAMP domain-containing protein [Fulvimarina endophytica]